MHGIWSWPAWMSWRKKIGWRGPASLLVSLALRTGAWYREEEEADCACWPFKATGGRARINTTTAAERRFPLLANQWFGFGVGQFRIRKAPGCMLGTEHGTRVAAGGRARHWRAPTPAAPAIDISVGRRRQMPGPTRGRRIPSSSGARHRTAFRRAPPV